MTGTAPILVVGDVVTDVVALLDRPIAAGSDTPARIRVTGGGQGANTAAWLAWLDRPVVLAATVGQDRSGDVRLAELAELGVRCVVRRCPDADTGIVIALSQGSERSMITQRGANRLLAARDIDAALAAERGIRHLHLSGYVLADPQSRPAGQHALTVARSAGLAVSVDAASAEPLREAGVSRWLELVADVELLLANAQEAQLLTGQAEPEHAVRQLAGVARNAVVKLGAAGAVWGGPDGLLVRSGGRPVPAVDPTGAGDAFAAGLLAAWSSGCDPATALARASELGAVAVARIGAGPDRHGRPGAPTGPGARGGSPRNDSAEAR